MRPDFQGGADITLHVQSTCKYRKSTWFVYWLIIYFELCMFYFARYLKILVIQV
jgi:hypothetical protein